MSGFELGQHVHADDTLIRRSHGERRELRSWVYWADRFDGWQPEPTPIDGIVVGVRTLSNGSVIYDSDYGAAYTASSTRQAVLIADHLRRKPRLVWADDVQDGPAGEPR